jgi:hypothetical protein
LVAPQVSLLVPELSDAVDWQTRVQRVARALLACRDHVLTGVAACRRHEQIIYTLARPRIQVHYLVGVATVSAHAAPILNCQELARTHRASVGIAALFAAGEHERADLALPVV